MPDTTNPWPAELDALNASAEHHKLLFENEFVRVLQVTINPGEETAVHTHERPASIYSLSWSPFIRYDTERNILLRSDSEEGPEGKAFWSEPIPPHSLLNTGKKVIDNICVEIKKPRAEKEG